MNTHTLGSYYTVKTVDYSPPECSESISGGNVNLTCTNCGVDPRKEDRKKYTLDDILNNVILPMTCNHCKQVAYYECSFGSTFYFKFATKEVLIKGFGPGDSEMLPVAHKLLSLGWSLQKVLD